MTNLGPDQLYERLRGFFNKVEDCDPFEIESYDYGRNPVRMRLRCDDSTVLTMTIKVSHEPANK